MGFVRRIYYYQPACNAIWRTKIRTLGRLVCSPSGSVDFFGDLEAGIRHQDDLGGQNFCLRLSRNAGFVKIC